MCKVKDSLYTKQNKIDDSDFIYNHDRYISQLMKEYEKEHTEELYMIMEDELGLYYEALDFDESGMIRISVDEKFRPLIEIVK